MKALAFVLFFGTSFNFHSTSSLTLFPDRRCSVHHRAFGCMFCQRLVFQRAFRPFALPHIWPEMVSYFLTRPRRYSRSNTQASLQPSQCLHVSSNSFSAFNIVTLYHYSTSSSSSFQSASTHFVSSILLTVDTFTSHLSTADIRELLLYPLLRASPPRCVLYSTCLPLVLIFMALS